MRVTDHSGAEAEERLAAKIRALRAASGLTRKELADRLGISEDKVLNLEHNRSRPYFTDVLRIASYMDSLETDLPEFPVNIINLFKECLERRVFAFICE